MDKPTPPPEAALLRLVRTAAGIKASDAAAYVDRHSLRSFSAARWSQIENGYETRDGGYRRVTATAATLAHMAAAVGLTPDRLAAEGERSDAAEVLREILRKDASASPEVSPPPESRLPILYDVDEGQLSRYLVDVQRLVLDAVRRTGNPDPAPGEIFEDPAEAEAWRRAAEDLEGEPEFSPDERMRLIAIRRMKRAARRRAGLGV